MAHRRVLLFSGTTMMGAKAQLFYACAAIVLMIGQDAAAQCQSSEPFTSFREGIQQITDLPTFANPVPQDELNELVSNLNALEALLTQSREMPDSYCKVLDEEVALLNDAFTAQKPDDLAKVVKAVADDIEVKLTFSRSSMALTTAQKLVAVTVKTLKNGQEEKGLAVSMTPLLFAEKTPMFDFPALSSPTTMSVPPGRYWLTASKNGAVMCKREVGAGLDKNPSLSVECGYE